MLKRLWLIFGPVLLAVIGVFLVVFVFDFSPKMSYQTEKKLAFSTDASVFKSATVKQELLDDKEHRFVPFFGSSEWKRYDSFHPAVLAEKYDRSYRPLLLGQAGAASLSQYYGMQQISKQMENKQAVFVISPQWFRPNGYSSAAFKEYFSTSQALYFLKSATKSETDKFAARRFIQVIPESPLRGMMEKIANGEDLTGFDKTLINTQLKLQVKEDAFFSKWQTNNSYEADITKNMEKLPDKFNRKELTKLADEAGKKGTVNNHFGIKNSFFSSRLGNGLRLKKLKGSQKNLNYTCSPEYADFQLALQQFNKTNTDVLFIIPPVNKKWSDYTGLNIDLYNKSVQKIKTQLNEQGFHNIADLSRRGNEPYFMQDTIHIGWNGWLASDDAINKFLTEPIKPFKYKMDDNKFLSKEWRNFVPSEKEMTAVNK